MFGSVVLDVAIGLLFVYLLLSLICSAVRESIEARLKSRALHLERGIRELLRDTDSTQLARKVYEHPLVYSLYPGNYEPPAKPRGEFGGLSWLWATIWGWLPWTKPTNLPSYIPARNFALALLDLAGRGETDKAAQQNANAAGGQAGDPPLTVAQIRASLRKLANPYVERAVLTALDTARDDLDLAIQNLQKWYDSGMDRVSGWYKRETQRILFMVGLIVTVALNVDTIAIVKHLAVNTDARKVLVKQATTSMQDKALIERVETERKKAAASKPAASATPTGQPALIATQTEMAPAPKASPPGEPAETPAQEDLEAKIKTAETQAKLLKEQLFGLGLPVGWTEMRKGADKRVACTKPKADWVDDIGCAIWPYEVRMILAAIPGWLITAFAISFGAPFWFDMLNKIMVIRSTVKPHEKSPEESSEDRQRPAINPLPANNLAPVAQTPTQAPKPG